MRERCKTLPLQSRVSLVFGSRMMGRPCGEHSPWVDGVGMLTQYRAFGYGSEVLYPSLMECIMTSYNKQLGRDVSQSNRTVAMNTAARYEAPVGRPRQMFVSTSRICSLPETVLTAKAFYIKRGIFRIAKSMPASECYQKCDQSHADQHIIFSPSSDCASLAG
jgi:hypothetical protein